MKSFVFGFVVSLVAVFLVDISWVYAQGIPPKPPREGYNVVTPAETGEGVLWVDPTKHGDRPCSHPDLLTDKRYFYGAAIDCLVQLRKVQKIPDLHITERMRLRPYVDHAMQGLCTDNVPENGEVIFPARSVKVVLGVVDTDPDRPEDDPDDGVLYCLPREVDNVILSEDELLLNKVNTCGLHDKPGEYCGQKKEGEK